MFYWGFMMQEEIILRKKRRTDCIALLAINSLHAGFLEVFGKEIEEWYYLVLCGSYQICFQNLIINMVYLRIERKIKYLWKAVTRRCSENLFLEISQNSQENTCARVSFLIKLQASTCNFIKKKTGTGVLHIQLSLVPFLLDRNYLSSP